MKPVGERKNSRDQVLVPGGGGGCVVGVAQREGAEELCWRSWRIRDCCRVSFVLVGGCAMSEGERGIMDVPASVVNSRSSFFFWSLLSCASGYRTPYSTS